MLDFDSKANVKWSWRIYEDLKKGTLEERSAVKSTRKVSWGGLDGGRWKHFGISLLNWFLISEDSTLPLPLSIRH